MHRALESEDIIYAVLEHIKSSTMDLVNVAMTCSTLAGPALNILWSEHSSLAPLIMCLPQDTWEYAEDQTIELSREPSPIEWERLRMNASRVRRLLINNFSYVPPPKSHINLSVRALQRIFERFPPAILFPKLCALDFEAVFGLPECSMKFLLLRQFMSPGLESLRFDVPGGTPTREVEQLLDAFPAEASDLRQLSISAGHGATTLTVPPSFGKLVKLIVLAIHGIDLGVFRHSCLLCAGPPTMRECTHFLRQVTSRQLANISIGYSEPACPTKIKEFVESMSTSCQNPGHLQQIYVMDASHVDDSELAIPLPSEIFRPLLKFGKLLSVEFIGIGNYNLDDRFINDVAVAWPNIRQLKFASQRRGTCTVTFAAMMSLASRCRLLQTLHLTFDATQMTTMPRAPDGTEVARIARVPYFLAEVFPTLSDFKWYDYFGETGIDVVMESALLEAWQQLRMLRNLPYDDDDGDDSDEDNSGEDDSGEESEEEESDDDNWI
ncbi:hypothetical protein BD769DRAFT_1663856 [Suillus cothurnatus]|nr:hypothetical protein BD769DRAFT_1663856 [Suillus cothurnatus]